MLFFKNEPFHGKESIKSNTKVIITSTVEDTDACIAQGFATIMVPGPTLTADQQAQLRGLMEKVQSACIPLTTTDPVSIKDALEIGRMLTLVGKTVFIVNMPKPAGAAYTTMKEYLANHTATEFTQLLAHSQSLLDVLIDGLPANFIRAEQIIRSDIAPLLAGMSPTVVQHYAEQIKKKAKTSAKVVASLIAEVKKSQKKAKHEVSVVEANPAISELAAAIAEDPQLLKKRIDLVNQAGVVGERAIIGMYFAVLDSRLLKEGKTPGQNALAVKVGGHFGTGKSYCLYECLNVYPEEAYYLFTSGSEKSLYYLEDGLSHKALIIAEAFQLQADKGDLEIAYVVRSLLSEGKIIRSVVEKDEEGRQVTTTRVIEGPTSLITTTVADQLEPQLEDRLLTLHPDEGMSQTVDIVVLSGNQMAEIVPEIDEETVNTWKVFHRMLEPVSVVIPFAPAVADYIAKSRPLPLATRRAFRKAMGVVKSVACTYQHQRKRNTRGSVIAEIADYHMAVQLITEAFRENMGQKSLTANTRLETIQQKGPISVKGLAAILGVSRSAVSQWIRGIEDEDVIDWVKPDGTAFADDSELKKAKRSGKACLIVTGPAGSPADTTGLPSPFDLTQDPEWAPGGKLHETYNLHLGQRGTQVPAPASAPAAPSKPLPPFPPFFKPVPAAKAPEAKTPSPEATQNPFLMTDLWDVPADDGAEHTEEEIDQDAFEGDGDEPESPWDRVDHDPTVDDDPGPMYESIF